MMKTIRDYINLIENLQREGVAEGVTPASTSKVLRLIQRHHPEWFDNYGMGEVEDTVVDLADMGQFSGMSAADALELVGQELESLYGQQGVAEGLEEQVYKVVALDKSNALKKPTKLNVKASSIEDVFSRLAANDWYALSINGVEVVAGKRLKQGVAEGLDNDFEQSHHNEVEKYITTHGTPGEYRHKYDAMGRAHNSYLTYPGRTVTINTQQYGDRFGHNVFTKKEGVAEGPGFDKWADERAASQIHKLKNPYHPKTWHDVDPKLGKAVDKMSQAEKVKKGFAHPDTLKKGVAEDDAGDVEKRMVAKIEKEKQRLAKLKQTDPEAYKREMAKRKTSGKVPPVSTFEEQGVAEGDVVQFPKKHKSDLENTHSCVKCGGDLQGGTYMGHKVKVCMPCKQVYLPPNTGIDQRGNKVDEQGVAEYGDTAKGQKMLTKVQKRAVDRMIKADDKRDAKTAKKNQDTANRAWDRMTDVSEEKQRLDPKCWTGYKKQGTKMKGGVRVNNCVPVKEAEKYPEPEQEVIDATRRARLQREREPQGSEKIDAMLAQRNAQLQQYTETGKFWLKKKDTQEHISDAYVGKAAANQAALQLLKQHPELKGNIVITAWGPGETPVNEAELSEEQLLARDLKKQLELFKQAVDHDLGTKPNDKELGKKPKDKEVQKKK